LTPTTVGMLEMEKAGEFSVMAVMLMPPTLIASVYGMNFKHMPELNHEWGYPIAVTAMVISAVIPFFYFRSKGWL
jgi:magnesium transporter